MCSSDPKFMVSTHVPYLKMKLPGPNGIITIIGDYKKSLECASAGSKLAESMVIAAEKKKIYEVVVLAQSTQFGMPGMINPQASVAFQASKETRKISINEANPDHTVVIGAGLDEK